MNPRRAEHNALRDSMIRFTKMLDVEGEVDQVGLLRERMLFARLFSAHLAREQEEVTALCTSNVVPDSMTKFRAAVLGKLRTDYSDHIRSWTPPLIQTDRRRYREAVLALQTRLRNFMAWEEANLPLYA